MARKRLPIIDGVRRLGRAIEGKLAKVTTPGNGLRWLAVSLLFSLAWSTARAVEAIASGTSYNTAAPTASQIPHWTTGWGKTGITGWDYVGTLNGASAIYLGDDWVITAAHVGTGTFTLDGVSYNMVPNSAEGIPNSEADLTLFQLTQGPNLPSLNLETSAPVVFSGTQAGSSVAMIGYGGGKGETWGLNTVTAINITVTPPGYSYDSTDFETAYGTTTKSGKSVVNHAVLIHGDSGGGDFIYDSADKEWDLAGLNEAVDNNSSYMVQLSGYTLQMDEMMLVPEPRCIILALFALPMLPALRRRCVRRRGQTEKRATRR